MTVSGWLRALMGQRWMVLFAAILMIGAIAGGYALRAGADDGAPRSGERVVTVYEKGEELSFVTNEKTVADVLEAADIDLHARDRVEPARDEELVADSYSVNIYRARPLLVVDGDDRQVIMTAAQSRDGIAEDADLELFDEDLVEQTQSHNVLTDGAAERFVVKRATPIKFTLFGETFTARTQAKTVAEFLSEKGVELSSKDKASLPLGSGITANLKLRVWREGKQTVTRDEAIDFEVEQIQDRNRPAGYRQVKTQGAKGERSVTYELTIRDGKEVKRKEISSYVKTKPKKQVEVIGAKFNYTGGKLSEKQITALGTCESGMTANRNSGNGFYGAFQFMPSTWSAVAPAPYNKDLPHKAPLDAQKQAVQNLVSRSDIFTQFPACARQMRANGIL